jgi:hypothetical protein
MKNLILEFAKEIYRAIIPYIIRNKINFYRDYIKNFQYRERKKSYGKLFPKKTFYIIRREPPGDGLFSNFHYVLGHIIYAIGGGYIPVVDMKNYLTYYNENAPINGSLNAWEYYFKQPTEYTLEEAYQSKHVILSQELYQNDKVPMLFSYYNDTDKITYYHQIISKYLKFNDITIEAARKKRELLFSDKKNILGVMSRGTDYRFASGHNTVPTTNLLIEKTKLLFKDWKMEWVYLVTEENDVVNIFYEAFNTCLLTTDSKRVCNYNANMGFIPQIEFNREKDKYFKGLEYIIDIILLSQCDSIICPKVNGAIAAIELNNNKYRNKYIFELGTNP